MAIDIHAFGSLIVVGVWDDDDVYYCDDCTEAHPQNVTEFEFWFLNQFDAGQFYCEGADVLDGGLIEEDALIEVDRLYGEFYAQPV